MDSLVFRRFIATGTARAVFVLFALTLHVGVGATNSAPAVEANTGFSHTGQGSKRAVAVQSIAYSAPSAGAGPSAMRNALGKIGKPYRYGASGPNAFDCSGLVHWAYEQEGVSLPRTSRAMASVGRPVSRGQLRPGDIVLFYHPVSHVAIYIGNGMVVHASTAGKPVKTARLDAMPFNSARRI